MKDPLEMRAPQVGPITIECQDTGAPRGERNLWYIRVNGVIVFQHYGARCPKVVADLYADLCRALKVEPG